MAKEIIVGTLGTLYPVKNKISNGVHSVNGADRDFRSLRQVLQKHTRPDGTKMYTPLTAYSLMVFVLLYVPCLAVIAAIKLT